MDSKNSNNFLNDRETGCLTTESFSETFNDILGKEIFMKFLAYGRENDISEIIRLMKCYELCIKFLSDKNKEEGLNIINRILALCPPRFWKTRESNKKFKRQNILNTIKDLKTECANLIHGFPEIQSFKNNLFNNNVK